MEYASIVWDPHQITYINSLEGIQCRAARWATSVYSRFTQGRMEGGFLGFQETPLTAKQFLK